MLKRRLGTRRMSAFSAARRGGAALDAAHEQVNGVRYSPHALLPLCEGGRHWLRRAAGQAAPAPPGAAPTRASVLTCAVSAMLPAVPLAPCSQHAGLAAPLWGWAAACRSALHCADAGAWVARSHPLCRLAFTAHALAAVQPCSHFGAHDGNGCTTALPHRPHPAAAKHPHPPLGVEREAVHPRPPRNATHTGRPSRHQDALQHPAQRPHLAGSVCAGACTAAQRAPACAAGGAWRHGFCRNQGLHDRMSAPRHARLVRTSCQIHAHPVCRSNGEWPGCVAWGTLRLGAC